MKRILVILSGILLTYSTFAQKPLMTLTFTAYNNGQHVPLDSIFIENLTQGGDTTLFAPDTVLLLDYITGVNENETMNGKEFTVSQNYPNPMKGKTTIDLHLPKSENIFVKITDIMGRDLIHKEYRLERGSHSFSFYPGMESLYFLTVQTDHQSRTVKMFNSPSFAHRSAIYKLEYIGQHSSFSAYKSKADLNSFQFNLGDQLKYTSYSLLGEQVITDTPADDQTYYFDYSGYPCPDFPTVTDIDGNIYNTVLIGDQCWMKENLKTTTYNNGIAIPNVTDPDEWIDLTSGAYVWYNNDITWKYSYGALYNWYATMDANSLCPTGWHVPTNDEWTALTDFIGGTGSPHGNELKSCRQVNSPLGGGCNTSEHPRWNEDDTQYGTDDYGFSGLPGGYRGSDGLFYDVSKHGLWWSSTGLSFANAWFRYLYYSYGGVGVYWPSKQVSASVRCLRD